MTDRSRPSFVVASRSLPRVLVGLLAMTVLVLTRPADAQGLFGASPELELHVYGESEFMVRDNAPTWNTFSIPRFDLITSADLGRLSFLAEVIFRATPSNEFDIDVERAQVSYLVSNLLRLKMGRMHTAFGYYNDAYHQGAIFELATGRGYLNGFEDSGGLLTANLIGVTADGTLSLHHAGSLHYDLEFGNGRTPISDVASFDAFKDFKLVNLRLRYLPRFFEGLILGTNVLIDEVPAGVATSDANTTGPHNALREFVVGAHAAYMEHGWHVILESAWIRHQDEVTGQVFSHFAAFAELGHSIGAITPYIRWEQIRFDRAVDPTYLGSALGGAADVRDARVGINWRTGPHVVLKLEGRSLDIDGNHQESATFQLAFGF